MIGRKKYIIHKCKLIQSKPYKRKCPRRWKLSHDFLRRFHSFYSFLCTFLFPTKIIWKKIILLNLVNHKKIINSRFLFVNLSKSMYTFIMFIWFVSFSIHYLWLVTSKWRCKGLFNADKTVLGAVLSRLPWIIDDSDIQKTWLKKNITLHCKRTLVCMVAYFCPCI